jgi:hypothetical protein
MTETASRLTQNMGFRFVPLPNEPDRLIFWPSAVAVAAVGAQRLIGQTTDLSDHSGPPFWLILFVLPILCGIIVLSILWIGCVIKYLFFWRWRRLVSACIAPVVIVAALRPIAIEHDPLHRFIYSRALEARAAKTNLPLGQRFAALDISSGLFVPPLTLLIYDGSDKLGLPHDRHSAPIQTRGSKSDQSILLACSGVSEYLLPHYYICNPQQDTILPPR